MSEGSDSAIGGFDCDADTKRKIVNRLKRARGQLDAVIAAAEKGESCKNTITQLSAVTHALNRAGFVIIATAMRQCVIDEVEGEAGAGAAAVGEGTAREGAAREGVPAGSPAEAESLPTESLTTEELEKIFLSLV
ncbi:metal-sensitive transcriptional regulator [Schaalia vaccimaxillae]|uniref:metal-sensitive transcriptional regulator n=1 Tax=Schaalia vaccimaxillae TaxID=183916 RepID=UPI0003B3A581|nr:metal-sensitive transcriptional regulator [Schaalia vaccimaxillae]